MGKSEEKEYYPGNEYQGLFNLMHEQHGLTLLVSEMNEIVEEVRKMNSQSPTIEQHDTIYYATEINTLQEGDWFEGTEDQYKYVLELDLSRFDLFEQIGEDELERIIRVGFCAIDDDIETTHELKFKKTKLTPEEFLRRADNTFKK